MRGPSFTARGVAQVRASIDRPSADPARAAAADRLANDLRTRLPLRLGRTIRGYIGARTRYFDDIVREAATTPNAQIVVVGAGYDDRAIRFGRPALTFVEIDHPETQADKLARLRRLGIQTDGVTYLPANLESPSDALRLDRLLEPSKPTTIVCEALVPYLTRPAVQRLMTSLATAPGIRRTLAVEMPVVPRSLAGRVALTLLRLGTAVTREPIHTLCATAQDAEDLLADAGWSITNHTNGEQLGMPTAAHGISYTAAEA